MRGVAAGLLVLGLVVLGGCEGTPAADPTTPAAPTPTTTPLSAYSTPIRATVSRSLFCDRVSPTAIEHAIGGPADASKSWVNGDVVPRAGQPGHEYGCSWQTASNSTGGGYASAWVYAPPITRARAVTLARTPPGSKCRHLTPQDAPPFGEPSTAYSCPDGTGAARFVLAGLFGDAWLSCEIRVPQGEDNPADEFCGAILAAASSAIG
jgi:hypothetical protein